MLKQVAIESGIVFVLTAMLVAVAATAGLPGGPDDPAKAADLHFETAVNPPAVLHSGCPGLFHRQILADGPMSDNVACGNHETGLTLCSKFKTRSAEHCHESNREP